MMCDDSRSSFHEESKVGSSRNRRTWAEQVDRYDNGMESSESSLLLSDNSGDGIKPPKSNSKEREIQVEFIDSANKEKFERLVEQNALSTPLKRRLSAASSNYSSRSNSPTPAEGKHMKTNKKAQFNGLHGQEKRMRSCRSSSSLSSNSSSSSRETEPSVLMRRQKQIDYGKNTLAYERYVEQIPRNQRSKDDPHTPNKNIKYSRRAFDGLVKIWRKKLHEYDPPQEERHKDKNAAECSSDSDTDSDFDF